MKTAAEVAEYVLERLGQIYKRPLMYGGTPEGVDLILSTYHDLWAAILGRQLEFRQICEAVHTKNKCGSGSFAHRYRRRKPQAADNEIVEFVVAKWMEITEGLAAPIPWDKIERAFEIAGRSPLASGRMRTPKS